jgi:hypothetical protein
MTHACDRPARPTVITMWSMRRKALGAPQCSCEGAGHRDADSDSFGLLIELSERGVGRQKSESVLALQSQHAWYALDCGSFGLQAVC